NPDAAPYFGRTGLVWAVMYQQLEVVRLLLERGADPSRHEEHIPFGAEGLVAVLFATNRDDPVIRQLHELLKPGSAELPPQVPSRRSPSVDRPARSAPGPPPATSGGKHRWITEPAIACCTGKGRGTAARRGEVWSPARPVSPYRLSISRAERWPGQPVVPLKIAARSAGQRCSARRSRSTPSRIWSTAP